MRTSSIGKGTIFLYVFFIVLLFLGVAVWFRDFSPYTSIGLLIVSILLPALDLTEIKVENEQGVKNLKYPRWIWNVLFKGVTRQRTNWYNGLIFFIALLSVALYGVSSQGHVNQPMVPATPTKAALTSDSFLLFSIAFAVLGYAVKSHIRDVTPIEKPESPTYKEAAAKVFESDHKELVKLDRAIEKLSQIHDSRPGFIIDGWEILLNYLDCYSLDAPPTFALTDTFRGFKTELSRAIEISMDILNSDRQPASRGTLLLEVKPTEFALYYCKPHSGQQRDKCTQHLGKALRLWEKTMQQGNDLFTAFRSL